MVEAVVLPAPLLAVAAGTVNRVVVVLVASLPRLGRRG